MGFANEEKPGNEKPAKPLLVATDHLQDRECRRARLASGPPPSRVLPSGSFFARVCFGVGGPCGHVVRRARLKYFRRADRCSRNFSSREIRSAHVMHNAILLPWSVRKQCSSTPHAACDVSVVPFSVLWCERKDSKATLGSKIFGSDSALFALTSVFTLLKLNLEASKVLKKTTGFHALNTNVHKRTLTSAPQRTRSLCLQTSNAEPVMLIF